MAAQIDNILSQVQLDNKFRVRGDAVALITSTRTLTSSLATLIHNDGNETQNLKLGGTIPMFFQGIQYNIPVDLYIPTRYPMQPPSVFVRPTQNMIVRANHPNVDIDGTVRIPYLTQWNNNNSLTQLVQNLSTHFSQDPPLYTKPTSSTPLVNTSANLSSNFSEPNWYSSDVTDPYTATTSLSYGHMNYTNNNAYSHNPTATLSNSMGSSSNMNNKNSNTYAPSSTIGYYNPNPTTKLPNGTSYETHTANNSYKSSYSSSNSYNHLNHIPTSSATLAPTLSRRQKLENELTVKLQRELSNIQQKFHTDIQFEISTQRQLNESYVKASADLKNVEKWRNDLSEALTDINTKHLELEAWADEQERTKDEIDIESYIVPYDDLSAQLIKLSAEQKAIEDLIYYLEKALVASVIDLPSFLKEIRRLAHLQFLTRMHVLKINASVAHANASSSL